MGHAEELLQPMIAELPRKIPEPDHVLEKLVHRVPLWWVVSGNRAE